MPLTLEPNRSLLARPRLCNQRLATAQTLSSGQIHRLPVAEIDLNSELPHSSLAKGILKKAFHFGRSFFLLKIKV